MKSYFAIVGCLLILSDAALAQRAGGADRPSPQLPDVDKETMILDIPDKWYPYSRRTDAMVDTYIFPTGQEPNDWDETLRQEIFLSTAGVSEARQVYQLRSDANSESCETYDAEVLQDREENGYSMFYWKQVCETAEQVVASLNKAILGSEQLYILSKVWKYEPRDRDWERWEAYFQEVYVCDPTRPEHRCRPIRPDGAMGGRGR